MEKTVVGLPTSRPVSCSFSCLVSSWSCWLSSFVLGHLIPCLASKNLIGSGEIETVRFLRVPFLSETEKPYSIIINLMPLSFEENFHVNFVLILILLLLSYVGFHSFPAN